MLDIRTKKQYCAFEHCTIAWKYHENITVIDLALSHEHLFPHNLLFRSFGYYFIGVILERCLVENDMPSR